MYMNSKHVYLLKTLLVSVLTHAMEVTVLYVIIYEASECFIERGGHSTSHY